MLGDRCCTSLLTSVRVPSAFGFKTGLGASRISSTRVTCALNAGTSMYATWAYQFYEALVWALVERFEQSCALNGYETCDKFLIRSCDVCSMRLGRPQLSACLSRMRLCD